jgi:hypothetical protein
MTSPVTIRLRDLNVSKIDPIGLLLSVARVRRPENGLNAI